LLIDNKIGPTATKGTGLPGTFGVDYEFINASAVDVYVDQNHVCALDGWSMVWEHNFN